MTTTLWTKPTTPVAHTPRAAMAPFLYNPATVFASILAVALGIVLAIIASPAVLGIPALFVLGMGLLLPAFAVAADAVLVMMKK